MDRQCSWEAMQGVWPSLRARLRRQGGRRPLREKTEDMLRFPIFFLYFRSVSVGPRRVVVYEINAWVWVGLVWVKVIYPVSGLAAWKYPYLTFNWYYTLSPTNPIRRTLAQYTLGRPLHHFSQSSTCVRSILAPPLYTISGHPPYLHIPVVLCSLPGLWQVFQGRFARWRSYNCILVLSEHLY